MAFALGYEVHRDDGVWVIDVICLSLCSRMQVRFGFPLLQHTLFEKSFFFLPASTSSRISCTSFCHMRGFLQHLKQGSLKDDEGHSFVSPSVGRGFRLSRKLGFSLCTSLQPWEIHHFS